MFLIFLIFFSLLSSIISIEEKFVSPFITVVIIFLIEKNPILILGNLGL